MDGPFDAYSLLSGDDATPQERATALATALRNRQLALQQASPASDAQRQRADVQQGFGILNQFSGDRVLAPAGQALLGAADRGYARADAEDRNTALAQFHDATMGLRSGELERKAAADAARAHGTIQAKETADGTLLGINSVTGETTELHKSARKLSRGGGGGGAPASGLTPAALEQMAWQYIDDAPSVKFGAGAPGQALATKVRNRAAELESEANLSGNRAEYKANSKALASLMEQKSKTDILENTAIKNLDTALEAASKLTDMGSSILNLPLQKVQGMLGNTQLAAYNAARQAAVGEVGKLLNGATGSGGLSEGARHEVEILMAPGASFAQLRSAADIIRKDLRNRQAASDEQISVLSNKLHHRKATPEGGAATPAPPAAPAHTPGEIEDARKWLADPANAKHPSRAKVEAIVGGAGG